MSEKRVSQMSDDEIRELAGMKDPTTQLNYQIADMIADTFGRAVEDFDIKLADQIIAKVGMPFTRNELIQIQNGLATLEDDYGDRDGVELRERIEAEIDRTK